MTFYKKNGKIFIENEKYGVDIFMRKIFFPNLHIGFERWKYCMALDIYVSSHGRIKNASGEIQNLCAKNNYLYYKGKAVHRLVAQTFNPVPNYANLTVDHRDHNTRNNCLSNLEWVTQEENIRRATADTVEHSPDKNDEPVDEKVNYVKINGVKVPTKTAMELMKTDKTLNTPNAQSKIQSIFSKLVVTKKASYGIYTVEVCEN